MAAVPSFSRYDFRPDRTPNKRPLPDSFRYFNRIVLMGLVVWGIFQIVSCWQTPENSPLAPSSDSALIAQDTTDSSAEEETISHQELDSLDSMEADTSFSSELDSTAQKHPDSPHIRLQGDSVLARKVDEVMRRYRPHAAFYLMVDGQTNEILAWGQYADSNVQTIPTWLARTTFPAASLIKMVTATAAMETGRYGIKSQVPLIGRTTTLYSRQLRIPDNYHGTTMSLQDAFSKSVNPVMGLIGLHLGGHTLIRQSIKLGFNIPIPLAKHQASQFTPPDTGYAVAEAASGFTRKNTISPLHAAAIIRAILVRRPVALPWSPYLDGKLGHQENNTLTDLKLHEDTYYGMHELLLRTVTHGTAAKQIRKTVYRENRRVLEIGGKTGTLDGDDPPGRYDWFAGYAQRKKHRGKSVIVVVMQVHDKIRTLPSSGVAGVLINHWAKRTFN